MHLTDHCVCLPCTAKSRHENCGHVKTQKCRLHTVQTVQTVEFFSNIKSFLFIYLFIFIIFLPNFSLLTLNRVFFTSKLVFCDFSPLHHCENCGLMLISTYRRAVVAFQAWLIMWRSVLMVRFLSKKLYFRELPMILISFVTYGFVKTLNFVVL